MKTAQIVAFVFWLFGMFVGGMGIGSLIIDVGLEKGCMVEALALAAIYGAAVILFGGSCVTKEVMAWSKTQD